MNEIEPKVKTGLFSQLLFVVNLLLFIGLFLSVIAGYVSPKTLWFLAFFGLALPYLALLNLMFTVYWIIKRKKYFWFSFTVFLFTAPFAFKTFTIFPNTAVAPEHSIKVITYNAHVFDSYHPKFKEKNLAIDSVCNYLMRENADVICFQEFFNKVPKDYILKRIGRSTQALEYILVPYFKKVKQNAMAIFSKYPIISWGIVEPKGKFKDNFAVYADIQFEDKTIRFYNVHLQSMQISSDKNLFTEDYEVDKQQDAEKIAKDSKRLLGRMKRAFQKRSIQIELLREDIKKSPYPIVICGDFNDTPNSYCYTQLSRKMNDAFLISGKGMGKTYIGPYPSFRIDFILHSKNLKSFQYQTGTINISDHYPISCYIN